MAIFAACGCNIVAHSKRAKGRRDPTQTTGVRKRYESAMVKRFKTLKKAIWTAIVTDDGFGLNRAPMLATNRAFDFPRDPEKVAAFLEWLKRQQAAGILQVRQGTPIASAAQASWQNIYIDTAYQRGMADAAKRMRAGGADISDSWIDTGFLRPRHADAAGMIYTRAYQSLVGITEAMDSQISDILSRGISEGRHPMELAREINGRVDAIGIVRARTLARTETIEAYAESSLNSYAEAGIEGVEVEAEFATAGDDQVCPECQDLEGKVYPISEARGMIPVHPNCRCAFLPVIGDATGIDLR